MTGRPRRTLLLAAALLLGAGPAAATGLPAVDAAAAPAEVPVRSPREWVQYRLTPEKNPVIATDGSVEPAGDGFALPDEVRSTPVVLGDRLYAGTRGTLHAFDLATGEQLWQAEAPHRIHSEMIVSGGTVWVGYGDRGEEGQDGRRGDGPGGVLALDAATGEQQWQYEVDGHVVPTPVLHDGRIHAAAGDRRLHVIDAATGEEIEQVDVGSTMSMAAPAAADGLLYTAGLRPEPKLVAYDMEARAMAWETPLPQVDSGLDDVPPAVSGGVVVTTSHRDVVPAERLEHWAHGVDAATGEPLWEVLLGEGPFAADNRAGAPVVADGVVHVGSPTTQRLHALDLRTGEELWSTDSGPIEAAPAVVDGTVVYATPTGELGALEAGTGRPLGTQQVSEQPLAQAGPVVVDGTVLAGGHDGRVHVVPLAALTNGSARSLLSLVIGGALVVAVIAAAVIGTAVWQSVRHD
jgi:outer membrane protein assembly factor BamB